MTSLLNTNDEQEGLNEAPWYVKVLVRVGLPTAIAVVMMLMVGKLFVGDIATIAKAATETRRLVEDHITAMTREEVRAQESRLTIERYLRSVCISVAKTAGDRQGCVR